MVANLNLIKILSLTGKWLISTIAIVLIITSIGFFFDIQVTRWHFPVSFLLSGLIYWTIDKDAKLSFPVFIKSFFICILIVFVCIVIASNIYDVSYDGQTYHMEAIYQLKNGWNPVKNFLPRLNELTIFINHYAKGVELPQSAIYSMTNKIETGKATNIMLLVASFCLCLSYLLNLNKISFFKCVLISIAATLNPIVVNQLLSTYVDGQLATMMLCLFISILLIIDKVNYSRLLLFGFIVIIIANIKFTGVVYVCIFIFGALIWLLFTKKYHLFKKVFASSVLAGVVALCIVGFNPYIINLTKFDHPFYPLMGKNKTDIMGYNMPNGLEQKNMASKFFISLFAHTDNVTPDKGKEVRLKIPFTLNKTDIMNAGKIDSRIAGLGPFFSGIILLSIILLILLARTGHSNHIRSCLVCLGIITVSIAIMPESWWARYIPQLWYIPLIILTTAELYSHSKFKYLKIFIYIFMLLNIALTFVGVGWNLMMTGLTNHQIATLKAYKQPVVVDWGIFNVNRVRFQENDIKYIEKDLDMVKNVDNIVRSGSTFIIDSKVNLPKSKFILWAEKYLKPEEK